MIENANSKILNNLIEPVALCCRLANKSAVASYCFIITCLFNLRALHFVFIHDK